MPHARPRTFRAALRKLVAVAGCLALFTACGGRSVFSSGDGGTSDGGLADGGPIGAPCLVKSDCSASLTCIPDSLGFSDGYCSSACSASSCPDDAHCADLTGTAVGADACLSACVFNSDCRAGYICCAGFGGACTPSDDCPSSSGGGSGGGSAGSSGGGSGGGTGGGSGGFGGGSSGGLGGGSGGFGGGSSGGLGGGSGGFGGGSSGGFGGGSGGFGGFGGGSSGGFGGGSGGFGGGSAGGNAGGSGGGDGEIDAGTPSQNPHGGAQCTSCNVNSDCITGAICVGAGDDGGTGECESPCNPNNTYAFSSLTIYTDCADQTCLTAINNNDVTGILTSCLLIASGGYSVCEPIEGSDSNFCSDTSNCNLVSP